MANGRPPRSVLSTVGFALAATAVVLFAVPLLIEPSYAGILLLLLSPFCGLCGAVLCLVALVGTAKPSGRARIRAIVGLVLGGLMPVAFVVLLVYAIATW